jgi:hypothetical protein
MERPYDWHRHYHDDEIGHDVHCGSGDSESADVDTMTGLILIPDEGDGGALKDDRESRGQAPGDYEASGAPNSDVHGTIGPECAVKEGQDRGFYGYDREIVEKLEGEHKLALSAETFDTFLEQKTFAAVVRMASPALTACSPDP